MLRLSRLARGVTNAKGFQQEANAEKIHKHWLHNQRQKKIGRGDKKLVEEIREYRSMKKIHTKQQPAGSQLLPERDSKSNFIITTPAIQQRSNMELMNPIIRAQQMKRKGLISMSNESKFEFISSNNAQFNQKLNEKPVGEHKAIALISEQWANATFTQQLKRKSRRDDLYLHVRPTETLIQNYDFQPSWPDAVPGLDSEITMKLEDHYPKPTKFQSDMINSLIDNNDDAKVYGQFGSGKTAAMAVTIYQKLSVFEPDINRYLKKEMKPGPEFLYLTVGMLQSLCVQAEFRKLNPRKFIHHNLNGLISRDYFQDKIKVNPHICIGSIGTVKALVMEKKIDFKKIRGVIIDEAATALDMSYRDDLDVILKNIAENNPELENTAFQFISSLKSVDLDQKIDEILEKREDPLASEEAKRTDVEWDDINKLPMHMNHIFYRHLRPAKAFRALVEKLDKGKNTPRTLIFAQGIRQAKFLYHGLRNSGIKRVHTINKAIDKERWIEHIRDARILIATDGVSKGVDFNLLVDRPYTQVINFALNEPYSDYFYRCARLGRASCDPDKKFTCMSFLWQPQHFRCIGKF